ncbi:MAG: DUF6498-containing protein [Nanoarchaeota archaeon]
MKRGVDSNNIISNIGTRMLAFDKSSLFLLISNLTTIFFALKYGWNIYWIILVYWFQSIIIGFFNFIRILSLKEFSTDGLKINDQPVEPTRSNKIFIAIFFAIHYGFFHFIYLILMGIGAAIIFVSALILITKMSGIITPTFVYEIANTYGVGNIKDIIGTIIIIGAFFINHLFSFFYNKPKDELKKPNIGRIMFYPYARIIPMHLTMIFAIPLVNSTTTLIMFMLLKTIADLIMHNLEHN